MGCIVFSHNLLRYIAWKLAILVDHEARELNSMKDFVNEYDADLTLIQLKWPSVYGQAM